MAYPRLTPIHYLNQRLIIASWTKNHIIESVKFESKYKIVYFCCGNAAVHIFAMVLSVNIARLGIINILYLEL